jgi:peroxiredoxin Q/BCP
MISRAALIALFFIAGCNEKAKTTDVATPPSSGAPSAAAAPKEANAGKLAEGDPAPDVEMIMQDGRKVRLDSLKGQLVAIYFYPTDQTSGCTVEAQNFRDRNAELKKAGVTVIGVSAQDGASHKAFIEKEKLPFDLAVDEDKALAKAFGVPVMIGLGYHSRQTFLIGKDGKIKKIWRDVTPKDHADEVLAAAKA